MTPHEAWLIALITSTADGGCPNCVSELTRLLQTTFPEHPWPELISIADDTHQSDIDDLTAWLEKNRPTPHHETNTPPTPENHPQ